MIRRAFFVLGISNGVQQTSLVDTECYVQRTATSIVFKEMGTIFNNTNTKPSIVVWFVSLLKPLDFSQQCIQNPVTLA